MGAIAYVETALDVDPILDQLIDLGEQSVGIEHDSITDRAAHAGMQNAARNLVQDEGLVADVNSMARICSSLIAHDPSRALSENVNELPLPFISPLRSDDYDGPRFRIEHPVALP